MKSFDCTVFGGGAIGLGIAYELACRGQRICLVDDRCIGQQASWAAAGILPAPCREDHPAADPLERLHAYSRRVFPDWLARIESDSGHTMEPVIAGGIHVATGVWEQASLANSVSEWMSKGVLVEPLTLEELARREPALAEATEQGDILSAYFLAHEAALRTPRYLQALLAACRQRQVTLVENGSLVSWRREDDVWKFEFPQMRILSSSFCIAAGAWSPQLAAEFGIQLHVEPRRGQVVLYRAKPGRVNFVLNEGPNYIVPRRDGRLYVGSTVEDTGFDKSTTEEGLDGIRRFAAKLLPELGKSTAEATWAGIRPASGDGWPFLGPVPHVQRGFVATGHFRSGIALSPATALLMANAIEGKPTDIDLRPFAVTRK